MRAQTRSGSTNGIFFAHCRHHVHETWQTNNTDFKSDASGSQCDTGPCNTFGKPWRTHLRVPKTSLDDLDGLWDGCSTAEAQVLFLLSFDFCLRVHFIDTVASNVYLFGCLASEWSHAVWYSACALQSRLLWLEVQWHTFVRV